MSEDDRPGGDANFLQLAPGLARIAGAAWWRSTRWTAEASLRVGGRVMKAAVSGEPPAELFRSAESEVRAYARQLLDIMDVDTEDPVTEDTGTAPEEHDLRRRGAELLRKSADVHFEEEAHPAYERILDELAPDEARILRLLANEGPQASVDVRTGVLPVNVGSELVAPGLNMIGAEAGCRHLDRVFAYLNNLHRLGLVWFSREPLEDPLGYQVLEAQPVVVEAMKEGGRARTVRRSIQLTPFGEDFCRTCLPLGP